VNGTRRALALAAALGGAFAPFARVPAAAPTPDGERIAAIRLAEWIHERKPGLRVIDLRTGEDEYPALPGAEPASGLPSAAAFRPEETVVLVSADGEGAAFPTWARLRAHGHFRVLVLDGGAQGWLGEVLEPTLASDATPGAGAAFQHASELSRYFGGAPRILAPGEAAPLPRRPVARGRGC
jgi:rhodanese-related sulfurtransferase